ncbi:hypothetical protein LCGC14_0965640 [marine sediment metagenome]|uniref:Uncharacterized protein n=1 Tax=marine sediment metagenome TaxID=412755 RepID=A0A0F9QWD9_9ZZZZ
MTPRELAEPSANWSRIAVKKGKGDFRVRTNWLDALVPRVHEYMLQSLCHTLPPRITLFLEKRYVEWSRLACPGVPCQKLPWPLDRGCIGRRGPATPQR